MTPNPPATPAGAPRPAVNPKDALNAPGILLIVVGAIDALLSLVGMIHRGSGMEFLNGNPDLAQYAPLIQKFQSGGIALNFVTLALSGLVIFGAVKMRNLQSYGLALTAAIIAMIPCLCPGCCIGLPVGIWALVILNKPEVKTAFT